MLGFIADKTVLHVVVPTIDSGNSWFNTVVVQKNCGYHREKKMIEQHKIMQHAPAFNGLEVTKWRTGKKSYFEVGGTENSCLRERMYGMEGKGMFYTSKSARL